MSSYFPNGSLRRCRSGESGFEAAALYFRRPGRVGVPQCDRVAREACQDRIMVEPLRPWLVNYQPGVPADIELPTDSLVHMFERSVAAAGPAIALDFFGRETSYARQRAMLRANVDITADNYGNL